MKKINRILIITAIAAVMLLGLVIWIFNVPAYFRGEKGFDAMTPENSTAVNVSKTYEIDSIKSIDADLLFSDIDVTTTKGDTISLVFKGSVISRPEFKEPFLVIKETMGKLAIRTTLPGTYSVTDSTVVLKLSVPENKLEELKLSASSGDITVFGNPAEKLYLDSSSGDIAVSGFSGSTLNSESSSGDQDYIDISTKRFVASTSSGRVTIDNSSAVKSQIETSSGDIRSTEFTSEETNIETTSGKVHMERYSGNMDISSSSGSLEIDFMTEGDEINGVTSSGDVSMTFSKDAGFTILTETSSGDFKSDFPLALEGDFNDNKISGRIGDGSGLVKISTSSGDITIKSK